MPLYLKQTPAIIPQQAGIVILSGCKRLGLWSPARPHRLPVGWQRGHHDAPQPAALPDRRSGSPGCSQARLRPSQTVICSARLPRHPWHRNLPLPSLAPCPGWGHPMLLSLAPAQTLPRATARLPPKKEKKGAESPSLASAGSHPWPEVEGSTTSIPKTSTDSAPCIPALPWDFPHPGCSRERRGKPKSFAPKDQCQNRLPTTWRWVPRKPAQRGWGAFGAGREGRKGAADGIFEGDRVSPSQARWKRLLPSQGVRRRRSRGASEDLLTRPGCARSTFGHRPPPGLWRGDAVRRWHPAPAPRWGPPWVQAGVPSPLACWIPAWDLQQAWFPVGTNVVTITHPLAFPGHHLFGQYLFPKGCSAPKLTSLG